MSLKYLIRLDDACPTMNRALWGRIETILDENGIRPMVGIIPHNDDIQQEINPVDVDFWNKVHSWKEKGWAIALHGYNHCYCSDEGMQGLNPLWKRSEFAGLPLEQQRDKIRRGVTIMREHGINPLYFFAPSHTFDDNTLIALKEESDIRIISDTIAVRPYKYKDFIFIPQLGGHCYEMKIPGTWTFCLHPNVMGEKEFTQTEVFLQTYRKRFISFDQLDFSKVKEKDYFSCLLGWLYFNQRKLRAIR